jgi:glycine cleavage system aminomethyltransferase T/glycine/D-amino acid oxidase-like deaminating enzyme
MAQLPDHARVVIVGLGGIVGASVAHHLIEAGWDDIVGLEKSAIPSDIGSTSHASDFCYMTAHDRLTCYTSNYSREFFEARGNYIRIGGLEVARKDDDERMQELLRKVGSGKAFGTRAQMITAEEAKEKFPFLELDQIQGAMWDPDAGLVTPRSQKVAGDLVDEAVESGKLKAFAYTPASRLLEENGTIIGVETGKGTITADYVILCVGIWGPLVSKTAGVSLPLMPLEHPLMFFGPWLEAEGTGKDIVYPLFRDQGNSAYVRDTGDPTTPEGGLIEWGYYETDNPRLVAPEDILEAADARLSPSMRDLSLEQVMEPFERAIEMTPILGELGWEERRSFNGLLSVTADGGSIVGESSEVKNLWLCEAIWVKDGPGAAKVLVDWMTHGRPPMDAHAVDPARHYPIQKTDEFVRNRCYEIAQKVYTPAVHPREPFGSSRGLRTSPFYEREVALGGYFMEVAGWERAHGYQANEATLLSKYRDRVPERVAEWDNRHFWEVSNAEQLAMSDSVGMINLSHFAIYDLEGPDAETLLEYLAVAKVGGDTPVGKGIYTHFLDHEGGIHSDLTIVRLAQEGYRVICGGDTGHRDLMWIRRFIDKLGLANVTLHDRTEELATLGLWGPDARATLAKLMDDPEAISNGNFPFASAKEIDVNGIKIWAFRISYVGEQGWELYFDFADGLALWDALAALGVVPVGIETYSNARRVEKSLRVQNTDLEIDYNLYEAGLARPKVKAADFHGKAAYEAQRALPHQAAILCTLVLEDTTDDQGVVRYPVGQWPLLDPDTKEVLVDSHGRRSVATSVAYGPTLGLNIALGYLPHEVAKEGDCVLMEYFGNFFPARIKAVGYRALLDPENERVKT